MFIKANIILLCCCKISVRIEKTRRWNQKRRHRKLGRKQSSEIHARSESAPPIKTTSVQSKRTPSPQKTAIGTLGGDINILPQATVTTSFVQSKRISSLPITTGGVLGGNSNILPQSFLAMVPPVVTKAGVRSWKRSILDHNEVFDSEESVKKMQSYSATVRIEEKILIKKREIKDATDLDAIIKSRYSTIVNSKVEIDRRRLKKYQL
jgi:hypothetical protein